MQGHENVENFADIYSLVMQLSDEYNIDIKQQAKARTKMLGGYTQCFIPSNNVGDDNDAAPC